MILIVAVFWWNWFLLPVVLYFRFGPYRFSRMKVIMKTTLIFCESYGSIQRLKFCWACRSMDCCMAAFWFLKGGYSFYAHSPVRCHCGESRTTASMTTSPRKAQVIAVFLRAASTTGLIAIETDWTSFKRFLFYPLCSEVIIFCSWWFTNEQPFWRSGGWCLLCVRWLLSGDRWRHNKRPLLSPYGFCMAFSPE